MTCPAKVTLSAEAWGFKKEYELPCKKKGEHKTHEPALPANVRLSGEPGSSWAIKVKFPAGAVKPSATPAESETDRLKREWASSQSR